MSAIGNSLFSSQSSGADNGSSKSSGAATSQQLTSEQTFLQLLIAQIKNQDPTNPTDPVQFVTQLTQYSELEQLIGINQGVKTLDTPPTTTPATDPNANKKT